MTKPRSDDLPAGNRDRHHARADGGFDDAFFHALVEDLGVGVVVYDDTGTVRYANDALAALLKRERSTIAGTTLPTIHADLAAEDFEEYWTNVVVGETRAEECHYLDADGESVPVGTTITAIEVGDAVYHVATVRDATADVADWQEMERQDERLSEVASVISHDLRNPLNVAMGRAELAAMECDSDHLAYVERSLEKMEALITDVLAVARKGSRLTDPEPTDLADAVDAAWYDISRNESATLEFADALGTVNSREDRLVALFRSLLENAVVHAGPEVTVTVGRIEDGFFVADDGPGVAPEDRETVFEDGYSSTDTGTGFGLTIVEHVAAAHGWRVELADSDAGGARFEVRDVDFHE